VNRAIVRHGDILGGRWRLEGTSVPIALIRSDAQLGQAETLRQYRFMELTAAELSDVLAFAFPEVRGSRLMVNYASVTIHCVCGEDTPGTSVGPRMSDVHCICGRVWQLETVQHLVNGETNPYPPLV
jgi:hypothetical protein